MSEKSDFSVNHKNSVTTNADPALLALGQKLRQKRMSLSMTQAQLAMVTNVGREFIIRLERGHPGCAIGDVMRIAQALGLKLTLDNTHG